jgi:protein TonB
MFADSSCDSGWPNRSRRGWTTLVSFALQALVVSCLLLLPLLYTQGLPRLTLLAPRLLTPAPLPAVQPAQLHPASPSTPQSNQIGTMLLSPTQIPHSIAMLTETVAPPPMLDPGAIGISRGDGNYRGTVVGSIPGSDLALPPPPQEVHRPPLSRMMEGNLILRVQPDYPAIARQARVQGQVVLRAMISREGTIENLQILSGHPMLVRAALTPFSSGDTGPMCSMANPSKWKPK